MNRFDRITMVIMSIALLVVAATNSYINWRQNEMVNDLYDRLYILEAQVSTNDARCTNRFNSVIRTQAETISVLETVMKGNGNG